MVPTVSMPWLWVALVPSIVSATIAVSRMPVLDLRRNVPLSSFLLFWWLTDFATDDWALRYTPSTTTSCATINVFEKTISCGVNELEEKTYRAREAASNLDLVAFLKWNITADGFVAWINILAILFQRKYLTFHIYVGFSLAISCFLDDLHHDFRLAERCEVCKILTGAGLVAKLVALGED
jgi:hypothetical protein